MELTKEEEGMLTTYNGDIDGLGSAEKIVKTILHIPFAFPRIEAMIYRETFEDEIGLLSNSFSMLEVKRLKPYDLISNFSYMSPLSRLGVQTQTHFFCCCPKQHIMYIKVWIYILHGIRMLARNCDQVSSS